MPWRQVDAGIAQRAGRRLDPALCEPKAVAHVRELHGGCQRLSTAQQRQRCGDRQAHLSRCVGTCRRGASLCPRRHLFFPSSTFPWSVTPDSWGDTAERRAVTRDTPDTPMFLAREREEASRTRMRARRGGATRVSHVTARPAAVSGDDAGVSEQAAMGVRWPSPGKAWQRRFDTPLTRKAASIKALRLVARVALVISAPIRARRACTSVAAPSRARTRTHTYALRVSEKLAPLLPQGGEQGAARLSASIPLRIPTAKCCRTARFTGAPSRTT